MGIESAYKLNKNRTQEVLQVSEEIYNSHFRGFFDVQKETYALLQSKSCKIPDDELERILTSVPLDIIQAASKLSDLKTAQEVLKIDLKKRQNDYIKEFYPDASSTVQKEQASIEFADDQLLVSVYSSIIERAEKEISFSRELVMSAKKIWDARRSAESPAGTSADLPEYTAPQTYIK